MHEPGAEPPKKYHLLLRFTDGTMLSVAVQGWGSCRLSDKKQLANHVARWGGPAPTDDDFTYDRFKQIVARYEAETDKPIKAFLTSEAPIKGIGNGYLQDILFHAKLHPRTKLRQTTAGQRRKLYQAICKVIKDAVKKGGRDDELDLFGQPGRYTRILSRHTAGKPCPRCKTKIEKLNFMGGSCYVCPKCQPAPAAK